MQPRKSQTTLVALLLVGSIALASPTAAIDPEAVVEAATGRDYVGDLKVLEKVENPVGPENLTGDLPVDPNDLPVPIDTPGLNPGSIEPCDYPALREILDPAGLCPEPEPEPEPEPKEEYTTSASASADAQSCEVHIVGANTGSWSGTASVSGSADYTYSWELKDNFVAIPGSTTTGSHDFTGSGAVGNGDTFTYTVTASIQRDGKPGDSAKESASDQIDCEF